LSNPARCHENKNNLQEITKTHEEARETGSQGDQIGRTFAYWAVVFFGQFILILQK
jgi:hypothetical protein